MKIKKKKSTNKRKTKTERKDSKISTTKKKNQIKSY